MKRIALAASLLLATAGAFAQAPAPAAPAVAPMVAPPKCEPKPEFPGRLAMQSDSRRKLFQREFNNYKECMSNYVNERNAASKAHLDAGNAAVAEFNDVAKKVNEAQAAATQ